MPTLRDHSRFLFTGAPTIESINAGSLQRIADATEKMAMSYDAMRDDRDRYKRWYQEAAEAKATLRRRIVSLRGVITRLKNKAKGGSKP